jgi:hypothetical protein
MFEIFHKWHQSLKIFLVNTVLRKIFIPVILFLIYVFGVGGFSLLAKVFARKMLNQTSLKEKTFWIKTSGNEPVPEKLLRQS